MDYKAVSIASSWLAVALISVAYMWIFSGEIGDLFFALFLPVGLLVLVAVAVTVYVTSMASKPAPAQN